MYMTEDVGVAELRRNLSVYLRRVENGERFVVTDRNRPVAELGPVGHDSSSLDRLIAEGRAIPPTRPRRRRFDPIEIPGLAPNALTAALLELREAERW
jgi:prevent-host-death family protein